MRASGEWPGSATQSSARQGLGGVYLVKSAETALDRSGPPSTAARTLGHLGRRFVVSARLAPDACIVRRANLVVDTHPRDRACEAGVCHGRVHRVLLDSGNRVSCSVAAHVSSVAPTVRACFATLGQRPAGSRAGRCGLTRLTLR